jgi:hypothetical protein
MLVKIYFFLQTQNSRILVLGSGGQLGSALTAVNLNLLSYQLYDNLCCFMHVQVLKSHNYLVQNNCWNWKIICGNYFQVSEVKGRLDVDLRRNSSLPRLSKVRVLLFLCTVSWVTINSFLFISDFQKLMPFAILLYFRLLLTAVLCLWSLLMEEVIRWWINSRQIVDLVIEITWRFEIFRGPRFWRGYSLE